jgi:putative hydrolase of the HAD superfamily
MAREKPGPVEVVSWDVDGTLYDMGRVVRRLAWLAAGRGLVSPMRTWRELRALSRLRAAMRRVRERGGAIGPGDVPPGRAALAALEERWYGAAIGRAGPRPGLLETVQAIAARGVRQVVASDYEAGFKLRALGLADHFERAFSGEALGHLKPAPALFHVMCRELDVDPARVLHVGDRADTDAPAATAAGCQVAIVGHDFTSPIDLLALIG